MKTKLLPAITLFSLAALIFTGCALFREMDSGGTEQMLGAAGFRAIPVETAQQQASFKALTPYQVQPKLRQGRLFYVYPDPRQNVLYVGTQREFQKYQQLQVQENMVQQQEMTAAMNQEAAAEWEDWDAWGPMWY